MHIFIMALASCTPVINTLMSRTSANMVQYDWQYQ